MPINCLLSDSFRRPGFSHPPGGVDVYLFQLASDRCLLHLRVRGVSYTLQTLVSMLCNGKEFEDTVDYASTDLRLQLRTGRTDTACISQFVPTVFPNAQTIYKLLLALHQHHICCFLTGKFALYMQDGWICTMV